MGGGARRWAFALSRSAPKHLQRISRTTNKQQSNKFLMEEWSWRSIRTSELVNRTSLWLPITESEAAGARPRPEPRASCSSHLGREQHAVLLAAGASVAASANAGRLQSMTRS